MITSVLLRQALRGFGRGGRIRRSGAEGEVKRSKNVVKEKSITNWPFLTPLQMLSILVCPFPTFFTFSLQVTALSCNPYRALAGTLETLLFPRYMEGISSWNDHLGAHCTVWESPQQAVTWRLFSSGLPVHVVKFLRSYSTNGRNYVMAAFSLNNERT